LNDENIDDLFADYVKQLDTYLVNEYNNTNKQFKRTNVKPLEISQDDYINISESFKQKCVLDVLKPLYIGYVVTNITDINKIFD
jgi:hypothetical protein